MLTSSTHVILVVLSGGAGTRLWPVSRSLHPKQLLPIAADDSMLQATVSRFGDAATFAAPIIVGGEDHRYLIADQLAEIGCIPAAIILEPESRNNAAAIALAARVAVDPDAVLLVVPSDHVIADSSAFHAAIAAAVSVAREGRLVTFGIKPEGPETGYGYIEIGREIAGLSGVREVARFVEKPDAEVARAFVDGGHHAWNGGIFLFTATAYLDALCRHAPAIAAACETAMAAAKPDGLFVRPDRAAFLALPNISIDYAVIEPTDRAAVVPVEKG